MLAKAGHTVVSHDIAACPGADPDIEAGRDFFNTVAVPIGVERIVTNAPFKDSNRFIRHGLKLGCQVYVLLRLMAPEGAGRADLIDRHLTRVRVGIERLPPMHRDGWTGSKVTSSPVAYAWFVFSPLPRAVGSPVDLRRISWRAP